MNDDELVIAQCSDSHLFANKNGLHCGVNVYQNLVSVLTHIAHNSAVDIVIFTGDLTQDHSEASYSNFVQAVQESQLTKPFYYSVGNHDDHRLLTKFLTGLPFQQDQTITTSSWQINIINSKSRTPAGWVTSKTLQQISSPAVNKKYQMVFMHHHPIAVGYFIDRHGLDNKKDFWHAIAQNKQIKAIACGHVHRGLLLHSKITSPQIKVLTCPATSIQFDPNFDGVKALTGQAGLASYRLIKLSAQGQIFTQLVTPE